MLVHGAWHGGWCWRRVSDLLEKKGHKVFTPTMTGLGERSHLIDPKINLATHITDIVNVIKWEGLKDIVLVGHSYGGSIVSGVAEQAGDSHRLDRVPRRLRAGERRQPRRTRPRRRTRDAIAAVVQKGETAMKPMSAAFFQVNEKDRAWVDGMCTPHPIATLTDKSHRHRRARPHRQEGLHPRQGVFQRAVRRRAREGQGGRGLARLRDAVRPRRMVDMPDRLTEILLEVA